MEKYIVYRHYNNTLYWTYERVELTKKELKEYLSKYHQELKNIEVFKKKEKIKIKIDVNISLNKEAE